MTFLLFVCPHFYPSGGVFDFAGAFETIEEAKAAFLTWNQLSSIKDHMSAHIVYLEGAEFVVVAEFPNEHADQSWSEGLADWREGRGTLPAGVRGA